MATTWGAWAYGSGNGMRVGIEAVVSAVSHTSGTCTITWRVSTQNQYNYQDPQTITYSGNRTGTLSYTNNQSSGTTTLRETFTTTHTYAASSYGTSPGSQSVTATVGGAYNGVAPSVTVRVTIPARPYDKPATPSNISCYRTSDASIRVTWQTNPTAGEPYTSQALQRSYDNFASWTTVANLSGSATSWTGGADANRAVRFRVFASNTAGSSGYSASFTFYTTPGAPTEVKAALVSGGGISVTWKNNVAFTGWGVLVERASGGGAWSQVASLGAVSSWTDTAPPGGSSQYRVRIKANDTTNAVPPGNTGPYSGYGISNIVSTMVPPLAPTLLKPTGAFVDAARDISLTWQHNPGADYAEQTAFSIQYSTDSGATWSDLATNQASAVSSYTITAGTLTNGLAYQWRVSTKGEHASFSPWSSAATFTTATTPTVTLTSPPDPVDAVPPSAEWVFAQAEGRAQASWEGQLLEAGSLVGSGSGTTQSSWIIQAPLENRHTYTVRVRARATANQWSDWAETSFTVELLPPAHVELTATFEPDNGWVVLDMEADEAVQSPDSQDPNLQTATKTTDPNPGNFMPDGSFDSGVTGWSGLAATNVGGTWVNGSFSTNVTGWSAYQGNSAPTWRTGGFLVSPGNNTANSNYVISDAFAANFQSGQVLTMRPRFKLEGGKTFTVFVCRIMLGGTIVGNGDKTLASLGVTPDAEGFYNPTIPITIGAGVTPGAQVRIVVGVAGLPSNGTATDLFVVDTVAGTVATAAQNFQWATSGHFLRAFGTGSHTQPNMDYAGGTRTRPAPGTTCYVSFRIKPTGAASAGLINVRSQFWADSGVTTEVKAWAPDPDGWMTYRSSFVMPAGDSWLFRVMPTFTNAPMTTQYFEVDEVMLSTTQQDFYRVRPLEWPQGVTLDSDGVGGVITRDPGNPVVEGAPDGALWTATLADGSTVRGTIGGTPPLWPASGTITHLDLSSTSPVAFVDVQRRIDGGEWVTIASGIELNPTNSTLDLLPTLNGLNEYRLIVTSLAPSTALTDPVPVLIRGYESDWAFLNWGPGFSNVERARCDPEVSQTFSRARKTEEVLGRSLPMLLIGSTLSHSYSVGLTAIWGSSCGPDQVPASTRKEWEAVSDQAAAVMYRDWSGRRVYGMLGPVQIDDIPSYLNGAKISFSIEETFFVEGIEPSGDLDEAGQVI